MMSSPTRPVAAVITVSLLFSLSGCVLLPPIGGGGNADGGFQGDEVTVQALYAAGDSGGVSPQRISVRPSEDGDLTIDFSEDEVTGFGDMTRAASWNAVTVATLLSGAPLATQYRFAFDGRIDGPSAGALTTVGVLSLYFGDEIDPAATMTGTINPTGTVGTVGGIPEKVQGVIDAGEIDRVLIPAGQRNVPDSEGALVDVVQLGAQNGVEVIEVGTIYQAYEQLTGEVLPTPEGTAVPRVTEEGYAKLESAADAALVRYDRFAAEFTALDPTIQASGADLLSQAQAAAQRARDLQVQGLQGGAYVEANEAALLMQGGSRAFATVQDILLTGGADLGSQLAAAETAIADFDAFMSQLSTYQPESLTDVEALIAAYGNAFDSYSLLLFAEGRLQVIADRIGSASYTDLQTLLSDVLLPLIYFELAQGQLESSRAVFEVGRDNDGGEIADSADIGAVSSFFRRGADSNWAAFESGVIQPAAEARGESNDVFRERLSAVDLTVALSYTSLQALPSLQAYIGEDEPNADYAAMGYGLVNYARNAVLLEKYYNNGVLDENLNLVGVSSEVILATALDNGRDQVARSLEVLDANGTAPLLAIGTYEQAGIDREGTVLEKFDAISSYTSSFVLTRILAFTGGYPREGYSR